MGSNSEQCWCLKKGMKCEAKNWQNSDPDYGWQQGTPTDGPGTRRRTNLRQVWSANEEHCAWPDGGAPFPPITGSCLIASDVGCGDKVTLSDSHAYKLLFGSAAPDDKTVEACARAVRNDRDCLHFFLYTPPHVND